MTVALSRPSASEWELTVWIGTDTGGGSVLGGCGSEADEERLAELLAEFAGLLLRRPALGASREQIEPSAVCFL